MKNKAIFITLIVFMIGAIVLGVVAKNKMLDTVAQNKAYVDKYVENLDDSFVFKNEETISETEKKFYYTSPKYHRIHRLPTHYAPFPHQTASPSVL